MHGITRVGKCYVEDAEDREDGLFAVLRNQVLQRSPEGTVEGFVEVDTFPTWGEAVAFAEQASHEGPD